MKSKLNTLWLLALVLFCPMAGLMINTSVQSIRSVFAWSDIWLAVALFFADNLIHKCFVRLAVPDVERVLISFAGEAR